jgi:hypothetical protein
MWWIPAQIGVRILQDEGMPVTRKVTINRQAVLELIKKQSSPQTSKQMARALGVKEVSVRAAISWLVLGGFIRQNGHVVERYQRGNKKKIALYVWTGKDCDIAHVKVKGVDEPDREQNNKRYGDGLELQNIMICMCGMKW